MRGSKFVITYSNEFIKIPIVPQEVAKLKNMSKFYFYNEDDGFILSTDEKSFYSDISVGIIEDIENQILDSFKTGQSEKFAEGLKKFIEEACKNSYSPDFVKNELNVVLQFIMKIIRSSCNYNKDDILHALEILLTKFDNTFIRLNSIENEIISISQVYFERLNDGQTNSINRDEISKAIKYIHENYKNNITLDVLSRYVGISKNYFCMLFKKEMGENLKEYINKLKINQAKKLISERRYLIKEVAYEIGITNTRYFCKLFKRYTGSNPKEYKIRS